MARVAVVVDVAAAAVCNDDCDGDDDDVAIPEFMIAFTLTIYVYYFCPPSLPPACSVARNRWWLVGDLQAVYIKWPPYKTRDRNIAILLWQRGIKTRENPNKLYHKVDEEPQQQQPPTIWTN